jgi:hypothetical protein
MKKLYLFFTIAFMQNCTAQELPENIQVTPEAYKSCCGTSPVEFSIGKGNVYVPNVFTPNGDGINDFFFPVINGEVAVVQNFTILTPGKDTVLYNTKAVIYSDIKNNSWNGKNWNNGIPYTGLFKYGMSIYTKDGRNWIVEGEACAIPCGKDMVVFKTNEGCFYPSQANNEGKADRNKINEEKDCFN